MDRLAPVEIVLCSGSPTSSPEIAMARDLCRRSLLEYAPAGTRLSLLPPLPEPCVAHLRGSRRGLLLVVLRDRIVAGPGWLDRLTAALADGRVGAVGPVSNIADQAEQQCVPPYAYQTVSSYHRYLGRLAAEAARPRRANALDPFCFLTRWEVVRRLSPDTPLARLPEAIARAGYDLYIVPSAYVHRFGDYHLQPRPDLQPLVPARARRVLDVGCGKGEFGARLKARGGVSVWGIELDPQAAAVARTRLDRVVVGDVETISLAVDAPFDCIICGDVLEHLRDPWQTVRRLADWLAEGGVFIASLPNVQHWAIVEELARGRWEYLPEGILCLTHLRFFTRRSAVALLTQAGLGVSAVHPQIEPVPAEEVERVLAAVEALGTDSPREDFLAKGFTLVATKFGSR